MFQEQYVTLHDALAEAFRWTNTAIAMDEFPLVWSSFVNDNSALQHRKLISEYQVDFSIHYSKNFIITYYIFFVHTILNSRS